MTPLGITHFSTDGFDTVQVDTGVLSLRLLPELGGKLSSLKDTRTGREWLWRNPRLPYKRVSPAGTTRPASLAGVPQAASAAVRESRGLAPGGSR